MPFKNMIPFNQRPKGEHRLISQKGGQSRSIKKSEGAIWRHFKERVRNGKLKCNDPAWLIERCENSAAFKSDVLAWMDEVKETVHPSQRVSLINAYLTLDKQMHPPVEKSENLNINVNSTIEEWERRMYGDTEKTRERGAMDEDGTGDQ